MKLKYLYEILYSCEITFFKNAEFNISSVRKGENNTYNKTSDAQYTESVLFLLSWNMLCFISVINWLQKNDSMNMSLTFKNVFFFSD